MVDFTPQTKEKRDEKLKIKVIISILIIICLLVSMITYNYFKALQLKKNIISQVNLIISEYNIKDANIPLENIKSNNSKIYDLIINSNSFLDLTLDKKYSFINELNSIHPAYEFEKSATCYIYSNENKYTVSGLNLYMNGKIIYAKEESKKTNDNISSHSTSIYFPASDDEKGFAWAVAQKEVKNKLKTPSTAKFPTYSHANITTNNNKYKVIGYVDSENSYGAQLRANFTVEFEKTGTNTYNIIEVNIK